MYYHSKDKKSYSASQTYTDLDGNSRSFTIIDHTKGKKFSLINDSPFQQQWDFLEKVISELDKDIVSNFLKENDLESMNFGEMKKLASKTTNSEYLKIIEKL